MTRKEYADHCCDDWEEDARRHARRHMRHQYQCSDCIGCGMCEEFKERFEYEDDEEDD